MKKQIIIDGVEVLKEKINMCFILLLNKLETPETIEQTIYEHLNAFVKEWSTQLARKIQECEALKKRNEDNERFYLKQYAKKDSEVLDLTHQLNVKTQECEELKERLVRTEEDLKYQCVDCMNVKSDRYHKALDEIETELSLGFTTMAFYRILDIINIVKGEGNA